MRLAQTSIIIAALFASPLFSTLASASEGSEQVTVAEIESQISTIESQYQSTQEERREMEAQLNSVRERLEQARQQSEAVEQERRQALEQMNRRYRELVDNPETDISEAQQAYQQAVVNAQRNTQQVSELSAELSNLQAQQERHRVREHGLVNQLATYQERLALARVDRVITEFGATSQVRVEQEVTCDRDETIGQCESRADLLAKQRASRNFLDSAFDRLTESEQALKHRDQVSPDVRLIGSRPLNSGFSGQRNYSVNLQVDLQGRITRTDVCKLLELDVRYCTDNLQASNEEASDDGKKPSDEDVMHRVLIRSNVYDDQVMINGERYGSTPLELMLETGEYDLIVSRRGYTSHNVRMNVDRSATYSAELDRLAYDFSPGEIIQDSVGNRNEGPSLIVIPSGSQRLGNIRSGSSGDPQVRNFELSVPLAVGVFPVTIEQFGVFVRDTGYVTSAEQGDACNVMIDGMVQADPNITWEEPGYAVQERMPVTCVSYGDAQRYAAWLTQKTGERYRLASEDEWEYAARAGTDTHYWWGNGIGSGRANCFSCGTRWAGDSPSPMGTFAKNPFGLEDTVGNVWEWTSATDGSSPVARGGAYNFAPSLVRVSSRMELYSSFSANYVGFRVVREE
ncbi:sulfatase modifying factor 1 [Aliidiomarina sedimenti]|uniref:Sulfatase modifying factor 1 n=1 Tax=Aliidiomarina sedimenti TaxID=1933879 RepID=A0ABY0BZM4_9GAMM|nr:SUMF1/EgtB/PvdO family nonheme iron enzyme [Aliidiomarina sedimenti]RUO30616.1 sulfatase modifying factor 1 [Aliidiomarina sedimenti]